MLKKAQIKDSTKRRSKEMRGVSSHPYITVKFREKNMGVSVIEG